MRFYTFFYIKILVESHVNKFKHVQTSLTRFNIAYCRLGISSCLRNCYFICVFILKIQSDRIQNNRFIHFFHKLSDFPKFILNDILDNIIAFKRLLNCFQRVYCNFLTLQTGFHTKILSIWSFFRIYRNKGDEPFYK